MKLFLSLILLLTYLYAFPQKAKNDSSFRYKEIFVKNKIVIVSSQLPKYDTLIRFRELIKRSNIVIGEMHYQEENLVVYNEVINSLDSSVHVFLEAPFFLNILLREYLLNKNELLLNYKKSWGNYNSSSLLFSLIDSLINKDILLQTNSLNQLHCIDINDLSITVNREFVLETIKLFERNANQLAILNELKCKSKWVNSDWSNLREIVLNTFSDKDSLYSYFKLLLLKEIDNQALLPSSYFSSRNKYQQREKYVSDNFKFLSNKFAIRNHYFVLTGMAHCSRDNTIYLGRRDKKFISFTNGLSNTTYISLFYYSRNLKPYVLHKSCYWEKEILKNISIEDVIFPLILDVRKNTTSYDFMVVL